MIITAYIWPNYFRIDIISVAKWVKYILEVDIKILTDFS
jgi:hypothetical protein